MTKIKLYSASSQTNDGSAGKGSSSNPYTQEEYETMLDNGTWQGGYVEGLGYCLKEVVVYGSSSSSSGGDSDSWSDPWGNDAENETTTSSNNGNDTSVGGGVTSSTTGGNQGGAIAHGGGSTGGSPSSGSSTDYNVSKAVDYLVEHAYSTYIPGKCGYCATAIRKALEAGGLSTAGRPVSACDYDSFLPRIDFHVVSKNNYSPQKGDIIVLEAVEGHPHGHIAMYSGSHWISDFVQRDMWGGNAYRDKADYTLFRR